MDTANTEWTLQYEMEGSTDAAWVIRCGRGSESIQEVNEAIDGDDLAAAREWATTVLGDVYDLPVSEWQPHRPHPTAQPDYWIATN